MRGIWERQERQATSQGQSQRSKQVERDQSRTMHSLCDLLALASSSSKGGRAICMVNQAKEDIHELVQSQVYVHGSAATN
jgi:hypothetical protein